MKKLSPTLLLIFLLGTAFSQNPTAFFGTDNLVNTSTALNQQAPDIAMDVAGNYVIVWEGRDASSAGILAQQYSADGVKQGSEFVVNTTTALGQAQPAVAMDEDGDFVVVWYTGQGALFKINGQRYNSAGPQGTEFQINTTLSQDPIFADVAMNANGEFIVTWHNSSGNYDVYARRYDASGIAQGGEFIVNTTTTNIQAYPTVALADDGTFVIVWHSESFIGANDDDLYAQRFNASGVKVGSEFRVNNFTNNFQTRAEIGMDEAGNFIICWWGGEQDASQSGVFAQRYNKSGVQQGEEFQVNTTATLDQRLPSIAVEPNGNFMIAWESEHLSGIENEEDVFMQYFHRNGSKIGDEIQVNTTTTNSQGDARIASRKNGKYVVTWQSENQVNPTSDRDIYHELFDPINYVVNTDDDINDGTCNTTHCSLREAITAANTDGARSFIEFDIEGIVSGAPFVIQPNSQLPVIVEANTVIDATTQPNWSLGDIVLDGISTGSAHGFSVTRNGFELKGIELRNFSINGILLSSVSSAIIENNAIHSNTLNGINIVNSSNILIKDNYIGTNGNNEVGFGNLEVGINGNMQNAIIENNIIVDNRMDGININSSGNNKIINNEIGLIANTLAIDLGNTNTGISISNASNDTIINNTITYNQTAIDANNSAVLLLIQENTIFCNDNAIINSSETAPIISTVTQTAITGTSGATQRIEVFLSDNTSCSAAPCQGKTLLGTTITDGSGNWTLNAPYFASISPLTQVTATATNTISSPVITSGFAACMTLSNDDCTAAFDLVVNSAACVGTTTTASNAGATASTPLPVGSCASTYSGGDIWFKAVLPFSGNMLIRKREGTAIQPVVEAYLGSCAGMAIDCKSLENEPNVLIIDLEEVDAGSTIYFRVWDEGNDDIGDVILSAHFLNTDPDKWEICGDPAEDEVDNTSEGASRRVANEFVVQYDQDTTGLSANDLSLNETADLVKSCDCSIRTLQLWKTTTPDTVEISLDTALTLQNILQTSYNYIIGEQPCAGLGKRDRFPSFIYTHQPPLQNPDSVKVAIIDTGVDTDHILLENAFWTNTQVGEGCLPNDAIGYDFYNQSATPEDVDGHGTWVNGALVRDFPNEIKLDLMNMKFKEVDDGSLFDAVCGIYHAIEEQAEIIVLSWNFKSNEFPQIFYDALDEARKRGILIVTAAGNTPENNDNRNKYPGNFDLENILTVTSYEANLDGSDIRLGHYASFGENSVDIAALGFIETTDLNEGGSLAEITSVAGTTLAAPLVARTAAIIKGSFSALTWAHIKDCILSSVDRNSSFQNKTQSEGILNHDQAMLCAREKAALIATACNTSNLVLDFQVTEDNCNDGVGSIDLTISNATSPSFLWSTDAITEDIQGLYADNYSVTITDESGCVKVGTVEVSDECPSLRAQITNQKQAYAIQKTKTEQANAFNQNLHLSFSKGELNIYPNPFQNKIEFQLDPGNKESIHLAIFDLSGKVYWNKYFGVSKNQTKLTIDTNQFPIGIYLLQINSPSFNSTHKLIKLE